MLKGFITSLTLAVFAAFPVYAQEGISVGNPDYPSGIRDFNLRSGSAVSAANSTDPPL